MSTTTTPYTPHELANAAADWFASLSRWPRGAVDSVAVENIRSKTETAGYYGVQAVLLMFIATKNDWPPMSPKSFADGFLRDPAVHALVARYAQNIREVERRHEYGAVR